MKLKNIFYVFRKEIIDIIRDKRTVISMIVVPIVIIPILTIGIGTIMSLQVKKIAREEIKIGIINNTGNNWFENKLKEEIKIKFIETDNIEESINRKQIDIGIIIPDDFYKNLEKNNSTEIQLLWDFSKDKSKIAKERVTAIIDKIIKEIIRDRLLALGLNEKFINPVNIKERNIATGEKISGSILGMILPYMILILSLSGAAYPAIDLTAGEKERGTLETILVSPASSEEIILGKFLTVNLTALVSSLLTLFSYLFFMGTGFFLGSELSEIKISMPLISIVLSLLLLLPVTAMFSALLLSLSLFAKSTKEAQSYISPLMIFIIFPAMISFLPGFENSPLISIIPVINVSLNLKNILVSELNILYFLLTFISSFIYAIICIFISISLFKKENILFRV